MKKALAILCPSFIVAGIAEVVFLVLFDPIELHIAASAVGMKSHLAWYTISFLLFWLFAAASSAFTAFLREAPGGTIPK